LRQAEEKKKGMGREMSGSGELADRKINSENKKGR